MNIKIDNTSEEEEEDPIQYTYHTTTHTEPTNYRIIKWNNIDYAHW